MKKIIILGSLGLLASTSAIVVAQGPADRPARGADLTRQQASEQSARRFARLDLDNDGQVTREEARQAREQRRSERSQRQFERLDSNGDGSVSRQEWDSAQGERQARRGERRGHSGPMRGQAGLRGLEEQGVITLAQWQERALQRFDRLDADGNGTVTAAERRQAFEQRREQRRERRRPRG